MGTRPEDIDKFPGAQRLLFQQRLGHFLQKRTLLFQQATGAFANFVDNQPYFLVYNAGGLVGIRFLENGAVLVPVGAIVRNAPDPIAHAVIDHHGVGQAGNAFEVVLRAGRNTPENDFLRHAPAHGHGHPVQQRLFGIEIAFFGKILGIAKGSQPARYDGHLDNRVRMLQKPARDGVACLVVGDDLAFFRRDQLVLLFKPGDDPVDGLLEIFHFNGFLLRPRGEQGRLVAYIGDFGARKAGRLSGQHFGIHIVVQHQAARMHPENFRAFAAIRLVYQNLPVETAGAQQRAVQHVRTIRGGHDNDPLVGIEPVHLDQQLVQCVLALVVGAHHHAASAGPPDGVDFVDENDAGRFFLGLFEQIAYAGSPDAHEHLYEIGPGKRKERYARLPGHRLRQQRFARARRPYKQHALGEFAPQLDEFFGIRQEIGDFRDLFLGFVQARHVLERQLLLPHGVEKHGLVLADAERLGPRIHAANQKNPQKHNQQERENPDQHSAEPRLFDAGGKFHGRLAFANGLRIVIPQKIGQVVVVGLGADEGKRRFRRAIRPERIGRLRYFDMALLHGFCRENALYALVVDHDHALHIPVLYLFEKGAVVD